MSDLRFPASLRPIVSSGYSLVRGNNIYRNSVEGGAPRQGRDTFYDAVPFSVALITSSLGRQAFYAFLKSPYTRRQHTHVIFLPHNIHPSLFHASGMYIESHASHIIASGPIYAESASGHSHIAPARG